MKQLGTILCLIVWLFPAHGSEYRNSEVEGIVESGKRPDGVVFELAAWGDDSWDWAAPMLQAQVARLRQAVPGLEIALVSHGFELFDLSYRSGKAEQASIRLLESIADDGIDIHICGNFAATRFYQPEDFFDFVDVAASGPAQLEDYQKLGFTLILLEPPDGFD